ncbi:TPA: DUF362 domain-containing protein [Candidatus Poribacteria bacterium]|nr:DUF362 domain-containing protein [Candidatus Poribacteria bacterium]
MSDKITRRDFIKSMAVTTAGIYGLQLLDDNIAFAQTGNIIAVAQGPLEKGADREAIKKTTKQAIMALGGMSKFVSKGSKVLIKPNIAWNRTPEQAANTNPFVVEAVVEMCLEAGAKKVTVLDYTINPAQVTYDRSGIKSAIEKTKASLEFVDDRKFKEKSIPNGQILKSWIIYQDALDADVFINLPIAKHHSLTKLSLGIKNYMGLIKSREEIHTRIDQKLADLATVIKPHLTIMDAYRVLTANGPNGGTPKDVKLIGQVIAGVDRVAVDAYTATLFGLKGDQIGYIKASNTMGLGEINLSKVKIQNVKVA